MKIIEEKQNSLLNRKEVKMALDYFGQKTPSKVEVIKQAAGLLKAKEDLIYINEIKQAYGTASGYASLYIYNNKENLDRIHFIKRKKILKAQRDKELADRKAAKEGKPAEVKAEPAKVEVKPAKTEEKK